MDELVVGDLAIAVQVKVLKCLLQVLLTVELTLVDRGRKELLIVNRAVAINVRVLHQALDVRLGQVLALLAQRLCKLLRRDGSTLVSVNVHEHLLEAADLIRWQVGCNQLDGLLLQPVAGAELADACQHLHLNRLVRCNAIDAHPLVLQDLRCRGTALRVALQHAAHAVLGRLTDLGPRRRLEVERLGDDGLKDLLLIVSMEGWEATQQDVQDDTA
mmetsp:Transcript_13107/g.27389  ORF Transcript_13107/g.27389 Transcript_13107/m.27389 type:complete len:216 (-) Transcript_13107:33-680(-)